MTDEAQSGWLGELACSDRPQVVVASDGSLRHVGLAAFRYLGRAPGDAEDLVDLLLARLGGGGREERNEALRLVAGSTGIVTLDVGLTRLRIEATACRDRLRIVEWSEDYAETAGLGELSDRELLDEILTLTDQGIILYDRDAEGRDVVRLFNSRAEEMIEAPAGFLRRGLRREAILHHCYERGDNGVVDWRAHLERIVAGETPYRAAHRPSGRYVESRSRKRPNGRGSLALHLDVTERMIELEALRASEEHYRTIAETAPTGIVKLDASGRVIFANAAASALLGAAAPDIDLFGTLVPADRRSLAEHIERSATFDAEVHEGADIRHVMVTVAPSVEERGTSIITLADFTKLRHAKQQIEHLARHDPLTGLGNRGLFAIRWAAIEASDTEAYPAHLIALDLDRFKIVNDDHGHPVGDLLLKEVARRLRQVVAGRGELFRLGGDEFAVIVSNGTRGTTLDIAEAIVSIIGEPFDLGGIVASIGCSAGVASMPLDGATGLEVQRAADVALYSVKRNGRNGFVCYDPSQVSETSDQRRLAAELALALAHDDLELFFQPTVDLASGRIVRMETLLRWHNKRLGTSVSPGVFLPVAEEAGLIVLVDLWALRCAVRQIGAFHSAGIARPCLSVNISPTTLSRPGIAERMIDYLRTAGLDPAQIEIEMTRSPLEKDMAAVRQTLDAIRAGGLTVALDDFGAAGSGLAMLQALPFDRVKLHGSIIEGVGRDEDASAIASAVLSICRRLGRKLTAEGIETDQQLAALRGIGEIDGQGSLLGMPEPADAALRRLLRQDGLDDSRLVSGAAAGA
ncbi:hypothetical protein ASG43_05945 [Aureimonas sp. Leaf454]|uniref:putative bifunctional diguanylate cyclase/phosphodiesterase n=1 Tax=Aureimonas sp. Leaf454 TaxID=1736381 RepID=UPI0006FC69C4|nr:EAL domain-containing protein [Aureimonas sp. Leaf454]KQT50804.1 hypothetical protein ASG43_05945 [Aureimonas sp. Leaf454]